MFYLINTKMITVCIIFILFITEGISVSPTSTLTDDKVHTWNGPPNKDEDLVIISDPGFKILVNITDFNIDGQSGDYLLIKPGRNLEDPGGGRLFTYKLTKQRSYVIDSNEAYFYFKKHSLGESKNFFYTVLYQRIGEQLTTSSPSTDTTIDWPTATPNVSTEITVHVGGKFYKEYSQESVQLNFRKSVGKMANSYTKLQNMEPNETISERNVQLLGIKPCPRTWPNAEYCVAVTMAIPVFVNEILGYQLTEGHMRIMWNTLYEYLYEFGMKKYDEPDNEMATTWWIAISAGILAIFFVILIIIRYFISRTYFNVKKRKNSDTQRIVSQIDSTRLSNLGPDPLQSTPPLFSTVFDYHEPGTPNPISSKRNPIFPDSDNDLDIDEDDFKPAESGVKFTFDSEEYEM